MLVQGTDPKSNMYHNRFQPWICYWGMFWTGLFILINGYAVFFEWDTARFLTSCMLVLSFVSHSDVDILAIPWDLNIPIFFGLYFVYKISKKSRFRRASEMDFVTVCGSFICFAITIDTAVHDRVSQVLKKRKSIRIDPIHFCNAWQIPYSRFFDYAKGHRYSCVMWFIQKYLQCQRKPFLNALWLNLGSWSDLIKLSRTPWRWLRGETAHESRNNILSSYLTDVESNDWTFEFRYRLRWMPEWHPWFCHKVDVCRICEHFIEHMKFWVSVNIIAIWEESKTWWTKVIVLENDNIKTKY